MTISIGDTLPGGTLLMLGAEGPQTVELADKFKGRKVVLLAYPARTLGLAALRTFPALSGPKDALAEKGVDEVICVSVNDPFVMAAWAKDTGADEVGLTMLGDAEGAWIKAIGMDFTAPPVGFFGRSKRFTLVAEDGVVTQLNVDENPGVCELSAGETVLEQL